MQIEPRVVVAASVSNASGSQRPAEPEQPAIRLALVEDLRFRMLVGSDAWARLPPAVQRRFSKRAGGGAAIVYKGRVLQMRYGPAGFVLAQLLRPAGAPLPVSPSAGLESVVTVTEDRASGGQFWTRMYLRKRGFPQVIHSVKRFSGPTGLEEAVGCGIVMALRLSVENGVLCFTSAGYALCLSNWRVPLGRVMPLLTVTHEEIDATHFRFTLHLTSRFFGELLYQEAIYEEDRQ